MLLRNREVAAFAAAYVVLASACCLAALALVGQEAAFAVGCTSFVLGILVALFTWARYRSIARVSTRIDAVLHGERELSLGRMREGELAVLSSELEKMVARLNLTADDLEHETRSLSDSLANISHQLKTPLTSLSIMCELMRKRILDAGGDLSGIDATDLLSRLRTMQQLQERVQWLVSVLLKMARIDGGVVKLATVPVSVDELVSGASSSLAVAFDVAGIELVTSVQEGATFMGDPSWSMEALENVMKNCMEHARASVRVTVRQDALACRISVEDDGPGIDEADLPHVFERFYRGSPDAIGGESSKVDPMGVGIGLSLAQSLVAAQGGAMKAQNVVDDEGRILGARFDMIFFTMVV